MASLKVATVLLALTYCARSAAASDDECPEDEETWPTLQVETTKGTVEGVTMDLSTLDIKIKTAITGTADVFRGIPYAEPVTRFTMAEEKAAWDGPLDATDYALKCAQKGEDNTTASEDCLTVNVFTSSASAEQSNPVMVWIHGGGLRSGSPSEVCPWGIIYNLVERGIVVVSIQYRLGFLGFFTTNTTEFPANLGMHDQVLALQWVQTEIGNFGGDPSMVTIFGTSAGAMSVGMHTYSPLSRGLFSQALMGSGCGLLPFAVDGHDYYHEPSMVSAMWLCGLDQDEWEEMSADTILVLQQCFAQYTWQELNAIALGSFITTGWYVWQASVDGEGGFLPDFPVNLAASRDNTMPVILGTVPDEIATKTIQTYVELPEIMDTVTIDTYNDTLYAIVATESEYGSAVSSVRAAIDAHFRPNLKKQPKTGVAWLRLTNDMAAAKIYHAPVVNDAQLYLDNGNPNVRLFSGDYFSPALKKLFPKKYKAILHSENKFYVSSLQSIRGITGHHKKDHAVIDYMGEMWTNFAKFGDPTPDGKGKKIWKPITHDKPSQYMSLGKKPKMVTSGLWEDNVDLFNTVVPALAEGATDFAPSAFKPPDFGQGISANQPLIGPGED